MYDCTYMPDAEPLHVPPQYNINLQCPAQGLDASWLTIAG